MSSAGWDARAYDESFRFVSDHAGDLVALLDPQPGERILDLGCGTGLLAAAVACAALALVAFERREIGVGRSPLAALWGRERGAEGEAEAGSEPRPARQP